MFLGENDGFEITMIQQLVRAELDRILPEKLHNCPIVMKDREADSCTWGANRAAVTSNRVAAGVITQPGQLPSPDLLRKAIKKRQARSKYFASDLFGEPAWDMLLELALSEAENKPIAVTSLCIASGVPATTALRWLNVLCDRGLCRRDGDDSDRRRSYVSLSSKGKIALEQYFRDFPL